MADTFDPFDLPSFFDPLDAHAPPPPRRRRCMAADAVAPSEKSVAGAGGRLAHLLVPAAAQAAGRQVGDGQNEASAGPSAPAQRLADLENEVAILQARLHALETTLTARNDAQGERVLQAVATLIDARIGSRG